MEKNYRNWFWVLSAFQCSSLINYNDYYVKEEKLLIEIANCNISRRSIIPDLQILKVFLITMYVVGSTVTKLLLKNGYVQLFSYKCDLVWLKAVKMNSSNNTGKFLRQMNLFPKWKIFDISRHYLMHILYEVAGKGVSDDNKNTYVDFLQ